MAPVLGGDEAGPSYVPDGASSEASSDVDVERAIAEDYRDEVMVGGSTGGLCDVTWVVNLETAGEKDGIVPVVYT